MGKKPLAPNEEQTVEGMVVRKVGKGAYFCSSESQVGIEYFVDVMAYEALGGCDCHDFRTRRLPRWMRNKQPFDSFRCKHIRRVRNHVLDQIIKYYIAIEKGI